MDQEFEDVATQVVTKTQTMINKYRRLLMVEAEVSDGVEAYGREFKVVI